MHKLPQLLLSDAEIKLTAGLVGFGLGESGNDACRLG